ncbi:MAG TPA: hypothetical protein VMU50_10245 [Polyangia bacterium]|nr:hypothetical protein [Polyangia bacterium]
MNAHVERVVVVHMVSVFTGAGQSLFGGQGGTAAPPEQAVDVSVKQTIPAPHSLSVWQVFGWHW